MVTVDSAKNPKGLAFLKSINQYTHSLLSRLFGQWK